MPSYYDILGINKEVATDNQVRSAYRKLALLYHPDKRGEEGNELFQKLNEAYEALKTKEGRQTYDAKWEFSTEAADEEADFLRRRAKGFLDASGEAYSQKFRREYGELQKQYKLKPLSLFAHNMRASHVCLSPLDESCYPNFLDIYAFIHDNTTPISREKINYMNQRIQDFERNSLNEKTAIRFFLEFLEGVYTADALPRMVLILEQKKKVVVRAEVYDTAYPLYEAIATILAYQPGIGNTRNLAGLFSVLKKISDYAQAAAENDSVHYVILLQSRYFRHFYNRVIHDYWQETDKIFTENHLNLFSGQNTAKQLLQNITRKLSEERPGSTASEMFRKIATLFNILYRFEKDKEELQSKATTSETLRELGFHILDWMPALIGNGHAIIANTFMQAAICFHRASQIEKEPLGQMADESLATRLYITAIHLASYATPDIHLQILTYGIKYIGNFRYQESTLEHHLPIFQKRVLLLTEVFPLVRNQQANVDWLVSDNSFLPLLRHYLHTLVDIISNNSNSEQSFTIIDIDYVSVLYQAYEACLKGWYKNSFEANPEEKVRVLLMQEALVRNGWTLNDLNKNLQMPHIMLERDSAGWLVTRESLPIKRDPNMPVFRSIDGFKFDFSRGEIEFSVRPWVEKIDPELWRVMTASDLMEIFYRNLDAAIFSLDPVDPNRFYYPFNTQRVIPSALYRTQLHHAMLLTDYLLKFLTVGSEVQGALPYNQRPVAKLLEDIPKYLQKIVIDFHNAQRNDSIHRFWIEALEVDIAEKTTGEGMHRISHFSLNNMKMVVKKHKMRLDEEGNLVDTIDTDEDYEGWHLYVKNDNYLNSEILLEMKSPAIIFLGKKEQFTLWEGGSSIPLPSIKLENFTHQFNQFLQFQRDPKGKVIVTPQNELFLYQFTKKIAKQTNKPHHFTPEQIFAYEFTMNYDEFSIYFPIFQRLKQLSKMTIFVHILNKIKKNEEKEILKLQSKLDDFEYWKERQIKINSEIEAIKFDISKKEVQYYREKTNVITEMFNKIRLDFNKETMLNQEKNELRRMYSQIGRLNFDPYSPEVNENYEEMLRVNRDNFICQYGERAWYEVESDIRRKLDNARSGWANELSDLRRNDVVNKLREIFGHFFDGYSLQTKIDTFLRGDIDSVAEAISDKKYTRSLDKVSKELCDANPAWTQAYVRQAITGYDTSYSDLIKKSVDYSLSNFRDSAYTKTLTLSRLIEKEKAEIRAAQAQLQGTIASLTTLGLGRDENKNIVSTKPVDIKPRESSKTNILGGNPIKQKYKLELQLENELLPSIDQLERHSCVLLLNKEGIAFKFRVYTQKGIQELSIPPELSQELHRHVAKNIRHKFSAPIPSIPIPGTTNLSFKHMPSTEPYSVEFARFQVPGDGNCFFYALEHQLKRIGYNKVYTHNQLRQLAVKHMVDHIDEYLHIVAQDYIRESIVQYFERMKKDKEWAGDPEIKALAKALGVCIQVMQPNGVAPRVYPAGGRPTIYLAYNGKYNGTGHYDSLIPTAELKGTTKEEVLTREASSKVELINQAIILDAHSPIISYLLRQGITPVLIGTEEPKERTPSESLKDQCLWVPASVSHTHNRLVYGGVSITPQLNSVQPNTPRFQALHNHAFANPVQTIISASALAAQARTYGPAAAATPPTSGEGSSSNGGKRPPGSGGRGGRSRSPSPPPPGAGLFSVESANDKPKIDGVRTMHTSTINITYITEESLAKGLNPPYPEKGKLAEVITGGKVRFLRFFSPDPKAPNIINPEGRFLVREKEVKDIMHDPIALRTFLGLERIPIYVSEVVVPENTTLRVGIIGPQPNFGLHENSGFQYELVTQIPIECFKKPNLIGSRKDNQFKPNIK